MSISSCFGLKTDAVFFAQHMTPALSFGTSGKFHPSHRNAQEDLPCFLRTKSHHRFLTPCSLYKGRHAGRVCLNQVGECQNRGYPPFQKAAVLWFPFASTGDMCVHHDPHNLRNWNGWFPVAYRLGGGLLYNNDEARCFLFYESDPNKWRCSFWFPFETNQPTNQPTHQGTSPGKKTATCPRPKLTLLPKSWVPTQKKWKKKKEEKKKRKGPGVQLKNRTQSSRPTVKGCWGFLHRLAARDVTQNRAQQRSIVVGFPKMGVPFFCG